MRIREGQLLELKKRADNRRGGGDRAVAKKAKEGEHERA